MRQLKNMQLEQVFNENRNFLWGLSYRLTGNAADADDVLQDTFIRFMQSPPANLEAPLRPWLVRVAVNLSRDLLRKRRRRGYIGEWLPSPIPTDATDFSNEFPAVWHKSVAESPAVRYELLESVSFAFLLALENLTPTQRAVLLLRDVFDYNVQETAEILGMTETNVKTAHHRARRAMREYDDKRFLPKKSLMEKTGQIVSQLVQFLMNRDTESAAKLLAANAVSLSDGGGEFYAAKVPVVGREKVALFLSKIFSAGASLDFETKIVELNGLYGFFVETQNPPKGVAGKMAMLFQINDEGLVEKTYFVLATRKLSALPSVKKMFDTFQSAFTP